MAENYIHRLTRERDETREQLAEVLGLLVELEIYLTSSKFHGADNDYVHVSTDMLPRLAKIKSAATTN